MKVQERTLEKNRMLFRRNAAWWARKDDKVNQHFFHYKAPKGGGGRIHGVGVITQVRVKTRRGRGGLEPKSKRGRRKTENRLRRDTAQQTENAYRQRHR